MSQENIKTIRLMESYITYENHGDINLNLNYFPELQGKTNSEIQDWLNANSDNLYVDSNNGEIRKDRYYIYTQEEYDDMAVNGEDPEIDEDVIELLEYWNNSEVIWDKIKCEEKTLYVQ
jgi:hypothetical protein